MWNGRCKVWNDHIIVGNEAFLMVYKGFPNKRHRDEANLAEHTKSKPFNQEFCFETIRQIMQT